MSGLISNFYHWQRSLENHQDVSDSALVGYVLETNYDSFVISTNTAMQFTADALARGSFLLAMAAPDRAVLLRVQEIVASPLRSLETTTMYGLSKRAIPALDQLTTTDMSWTCFRCDVLAPTTKAAVNLR